MSTSTREIITLQLGNYANYIGTHWWNIQESGFSYDPSATPSDIDHDVLYREGKNVSGHLTYTPRLVLVDLKGSLKHLPEHGGLYESNPDDIPMVSDTDQEQFEWDRSGIEVIKQETIEKPQYQKDLDAAKIDPIADNVQSWTDFMYARYNPRTFHIIHQFEDNQDDYPFDSFTNGTSVWLTENFEDNWGDRVRQYLEECNNCQGFQTIFDCTDGFSGLTSQCVEHLSDEYGKPNLTIPIFKPKRIRFHSADPAMSDSIRVVNIALTYRRLIDHGTLILPLSTMSRAWRQIDQPRSFPYVKYEPDNLYETSAILATFLDTISLRYRYKNPQISSDLSGFCSDLNNYNRKLVSGGLALPFPIGSTEDLIDYLDHTTEPIFTQLSPNSTVGTDRIIQTACIRGLLTSRLKRPRSEAGTQMKMSAYRCATISEMLQLYYQCNLYASQTHVASFEQGMPIKTPYPSNIFDDRIDSRGFINSELKLSGDRSIESVPIFAVAQSSSKLADTIDGLHREAKRINLNKLTRFKEGGLEDDEYKEMLEGLLEFKENYEDNFQL